MSTEKFQNKYRLKSARAEWHDYGGGAYFITVCTKQKEHFFGEINDGKMQLSPIGKYLSENLHNITQHYSYAEIPLFVVMPNHWHAIVFIDGNQTPENDSPTRSDVARHVSTTTETMMNIRAKKGWLSVAIGGIKSSITKFANTNKIDFAWQTRFHDHIIRDTTEMNRIADYIENNPITWQTDCFNDFPL
jgi:REP element-mobilizing transposase RayT